MTERTANYRFYDCPQQLPTKTRFAVTVGSDLVVAVDSNDDTSLIAVDGDGNVLGQLVQAADPADLLALVPVAIDTARALFPNHLRVPLSEGGA